MSTRRYGTGISGAVLGLACALLVAAPAAGQDAQPRVVGDNAASESDQELARQLQNPVGDLISLPLQNNTNFNYGPHKGTQNVLNMQPVVPFHVNEDWNVITRAILPIVWNPSLQPAQTVPMGTAPMSFTAFLAPSHDTNGWLWGAGPVVQVPTISSATLGSNVWGAGPSAVVVWSGGPWVAGALASNIWSMGGTRGGTNYNTFLANPFVSYNFDSGWYLSTAPNITANWQAPGTKWTLPLGGGAGKLVRIGNLPVDLSLAVYRNVVRPEIGPGWQLSAQVAFVF